MKYYQDVKRLLSIVREKVASLLSMTFKFGFSIKHNLKFYQTLFKIYVYSYILIFYFAMSFLEIFLMNAIKL